MEVSVLEECIQKFNNLLDPAVPDAELIQAVRNLSAAVSYDSSGLDYITKHLSFDVLFELLSSNLVCAKVQSQTEAMSLISMLCTIFKKVMESLDPRYVVENFLDRMMLSSSVNYVEFQVACMQLVLQLSESNPFALYLCKSENVVNFLIQKISEGPLSVASVGRKVFSSLFCHSPDVTWLLTPHVKAMCSSFENKDTSGVAMFRIAEIFMDLVCLYPKYLEECSSFGAFDNLLKILNGDDVLSKLNALEMICRFAECGALGFQFIQKYGLLQFVATVIDSSDDVLASFLIPGAVKFFGKVAYCFPADVLSKYGSVVSFIYANIGSTDPALKMLCAETIGLLSSNKFGLKVLFQEGHLKDAVQTMAKIGSSANESTTTRQRVLDALAQIFKHDVVDEVACRICKELYRQISLHPVNYIFLLLKQPFTELKYSGYRLLHSVSKFEWVEQDIALSPGFMEYLLDRKTETDREGRELKYHVLKVLSDSPTSRQTLGLALHEKVLQYTRQGAFYSEAGVVVGYDEQN